MGVNPAGPEGDALNTLLAITDFFFLFVLQLVIYLLIAYAIVSWLVAFNVVNMSNRFVRGVIEGLDRFFRPLLAPIRRFLPDFGGIDLSPMVLFLIIMLIQRLYLALLLDAGLR